MKRYTIRIGTRFTKEEARLIRAVAKKSKSSVGAFIREFIVREINK